MLHRAALTPMSCSVLAHLESHQASHGGGTASAAHGSPATIHTRLVAARMDSQAVVYGSNGQRLRRVILTW